MSLAGTTIYLHDFSRPLAERAKARKSCGPYQKRVRSAAERPDGFGFYFACKGLAMGTGMDLRVQEVRATRRGVDGYYGDEHGDMIVRPYVFALPHGRGWLAGCGEGASMWGSLDRTIHETEEEAGEAAHEDARITAERNQEHAAQERERLREEEEEAERKAEEEAEAEAEAGVEVFLATILYQEGGDSCGEAHLEAEIFATHKEADSWVIDTLRRDLEDAGVEVAEDLSEGEVQELYLDKCENGTVSSAVWDVTAKRVKIALS